MLCLCSCSSWGWACQGPKHVEDSYVTYMLLLNCALKLVEEIIQEYVCLLRFSFLLLLYCFVAKIFSFHLVHGTHYSKPIKMLHTSPISLFKCNQSFHRKQTPCSNLKLCPIFNTQNGISHNWLEIPANIRCSCLHLMISYDCQLRTEGVLNL